MLKKIVTTFVFLLVYYFGFGQLAGNYIIGPGGDFHSLSVAMTAINQQGISDDVTFSLLPGNYYPELVIPAIEGTNDTTWFTIQSSTLDSTDVIFREIFFDETNNVILKNVTVDNLYGVRAMEFDRPFDIIITNCEINSPTMALQINHNWDGKWSEVTVSNCRISGYSETIDIYRSHGRTLLENCHIISTGGWNYAIRGTNMSRLNVNSCIVDGDIFINTGTGSNFRYNTFNGHVDASTVDSAFNNVFTTSALDVLYCRNNQFNGDCSPTGNSLAMRMYIENNFASTVNLGFLKRATFLRNTFHGDLWGHRLIRLDFQGNRLFNSRFSFGQLAEPIDYLVQNNIFSGGYVEAFGCENTVVRYNNFTDGAYLWLCTPGETYGNNFCTQLYAEITPDRIHHNNYFPLVANADSTGYSYDPQYDPQNPGIATNPLLQGKGVDGPETDILGNERKNPPAIGANEILICSDSLNNSFDVPCGEQVYMNLCNLPSDGDFWWSADSCIINPDSLYAIVMPTENQTVYLNNSVYGIVDSVHLNVLPYSVRAEGPDYLNCGIPGYLTASYNPSATYSWSPTTGLSDSTSNNTAVVLTGTDNMTYIVTCAIPDCGVSYDTVSIYLIPFPTIQAWYPTQLIDTLFFRYYFTCADEYLWDFGDGKTSTEMNPYHIYEMSGQYTVTTTAMNASGSTTVAREIYYEWTNTKDPEGEDNIVVFPNPAKEKINVKGLQPGEAIEISLNSITGKPVAATSTNTGEVAINTQNLKPGIYFLKINYREKVAIRKVIIM